MAGGIFFFLLGTVSLISQSVFLREIVSLSYGNELIYCLGLAVWFLFTGIGSLLSNKFRSIKNSPVSWFILSLLAVFLPAGVILLRFSAGKITLQGELPDPHFFFPLLLLVFLIYCLLLGFCFPLAVKSFAKKRRAFTNYAYMLETFGLIIGGLIFSFFLSQTSFPLTNKIEYSSAMWQFPNLTRTFNSQYQRISITKSGGQINFFLNGQLSFNTGKNLENQIFFNLIVPYTNNSKNILMLTDPISANFWQNKYPESKITLLEADKKYFISWQNLLNQKIKVIISDPKILLRNSKSKYNLIISSLNNPQSLLINRLMTKEAFSNFKNLLTDKGIFILSFSLPTDFQSPELVAYGASIYQTFRRVFPDTQLLVSDDNILLLGGNKLELNQNSQKKYFITQLQSSQRKKIINDWQLQKEKINSDFKPVAFFFYQLFWQKIFNPLFSKIFSLASCLILLFIFYLFSVLVFTRKYATRYGLFMLFSSFILISQQTLIIFMFQIKIGVLFSRISLLFACLLTGIALGVKLVRQSTNKKLIVQKSFWGFSAVTALFLFFLDKPFSEKQIFWFILSVFFGIIGGINFASLNTLYLKKEKNPGFIYCFDLLGGSLGAFLSGIFLLPVCGAKIFLWGLLILALSLAIAAKFRKL